MEQFVSYMVLVLLGIGMGAILVIPYFYDFWRTDRTPPNREEEKKTDEQHT
ncbi:MAG: hypothetical protein ISN29_05020 [Gammaproteobacteria bacterium AqS3]|nr:hypothetical protein [Gammaproteobacteria bacterium AqS3]